MSDVVGFHQPRERFRFIQHSIDVLRLGEILRFSAAWNKGHLLAFGDFLNHQRAFFTLDFARDSGVADLRVVQGDIEIAVTQHYRALAINTACQQAGAGMDRLRFAPQRDRRGEAVKTDIHNRAIGKGRVEGIWIFAIEIALVTRRVLTVVDEGFT